MLNVIKAIAVLMCQVLGSTLQRRYRLFEDFPERLEISLTAELVHLDESRLNATDLFNA